MTVGILVFGACGTDSTGATPVTGRYASDDGGSLFVDTQSYSLSFGQQLAEVGHWTQQGNQLVLAAERCDENGGVQPCSNDVSTLRVGSGTLDGVILGLTEHFIRLSP